jgi:hypothetical protein
MTSAAESFREVQYLRTWWFLLLILIPTAVVWWGAVQQLWFGMPWGNNPGSDEMMWFLLLIFGVAFPLFMLTIKMTTTVSDAIRIRFSPFMLRPRVISPRDIAGHQSVQYRPIAEYGGWGIKGTRSDRAYNVWGDRGVKIALTDGNKVMIGSQRPDELNMAINNMVRLQK